MLASLDGSGLARAVLMRARVEARRVNCIVAVVVVCEVD